MSILAAPFPNLRATDRGATAQITTLARLAHHGATYSGGRAGSLQSHHRKGPTGNTGNCPLAVTPL